MWQVTVYSSVLTVPGIFRPAEYVFEDCFSVPRHVAQETISSQIIACSVNLTVLGSFFDLLSTFFEEYFGVPRHTDVQETILSQTMVCSSVLTVPGGFSDPLRTFRGLFRCTLTRCCSGGDFVGNNSFSTILKVPGGFFDP